MGPISINNAQDAFQMLSQIQNGKSYMVSSDGTSLKEATLGHKIRQAFGFESAKNENQAVLDLIKNTLKNDPRYAALAEHMFQGVDAKNAITTDKIKAAFSNFKDAMIEQSKAALERHIGTVVANLVTDGDAKVEDLINNGNMLKSERNGAQLVCTFLKNRLKYFVSDNAEQGNHVTLEQLNGAIKAEIEKLHHDLIENHGGQLDDKPVVNGNPNASEAEQLAALDKTTAGIGVVQINEKGSVKYTSMMAGIKELGDIMESMPTDTRKSGIRANLEGLKRRIETLATTKNELDTRDFKTRVAQDKGVQQILKNINAYVLDTTNAILDRFQQIIDEKHGRKNELTQAQTYLKDAKSQLGKNIKLLNENLSVIKDYFASDETNADVKNVAVLRETKGQKVKDITAEEAMKRIHILCESLQKLLVV